MTMLRLKFVQSFRGYHYFRRRGSPRIPLPGIVGSTEFMAAYQQALAAAPAPVGAAKRSGPGSVSAALAGYFQSAAFKSFTGRTPTRRRAMLERFREGVGHLPLASLPKQHLDALLATLAPHAAKGLLRTLRHFIGWCVDHQLMKSDPTLGIRIKTPRSDGHHTWSEEEIAQFEAAHRSVPSRASRSRSTPDNGVAMWCASDASMSKVV
jgi:hypothetical protein